jgi:hypothetical protein
VDKTVTAQIAALRKMTVAELQREWERLYGEPTRNRNKTLLWKRLSWRVQELAFGGLSDCARQRLEELAAGTSVGNRTPQSAANLAEVKAGRTTIPDRKPNRDPRLPSPGTVLTRQYHGREIRALTLDDGFEWDGRHFRSLSAMARAVTGAKWNGRLFFHLTERKRKS